MNLSFLTSKPRSYVRNPESRPNIPEEPTTEAQIVVLQMMQPRGRSGNTLCLDWRASEPLPLAESRGRRRISTMVGAIV